MPRKLEIILHYLGVAFVAGGSLVALYSAWAVLAYGNVREPPQFKYVWPAAAAVGAVVLLWQLGTDLRAGGALPNSAFWGPFRKLIALHMLGWTAVLTVLFVIPLLSYGDSAAWSALMLGFPLGFVTGACDAVMKTSYAAQKRGDPSLLASPSVIIDGIVYGVFAATIVVLVLAFGFGMTDRRDLFGGWRVTWWPIGGAVIFAIANLWRYRRRNRSEIGDAPILEKVGSTLDNIADGTRRVKDFGLGLLILAVGGVWTYLVLVQFPSLPKEELSSPGFVFGGLLVAVPGIVVGFIGLRKLVKALLGPPRISGGGLGRAKRSAPEDVARKHARGEVG